MNTSTTILDVIQHYQRSIERCQDDEHRLLHCINKLYRLPVKVKHLQETGIGKTVNYLRKFNGEIGVAAKALVTKWKAMVAAEEEPKDIGCQPNVEDIPNTNGKGSSDEDNCDNNKNDSGRIKEQQNSELKPLERRRSSDDDDSHKEEESNKNENKRPSDEKGGSDHRNSHKRKPEHKSEHSESERGNSAKRHKSEKPDKDEWKGKERKSNNSGEKHREEREKKSASGSSHRTKSSSNGSSSIKKIDNNKEEQRHHHEKESKHRDGGSNSSKHSSSKDRRGRHEKSKDKTQEQDTNKSSSKEAEVRHSKKPSSSSSSTRPPYSSTDTGADRKRKRDSDNDSGEGKSPSIKAVKKDKVSKKSSNGSEDDAEDGIDSSMGANFADVLGMLNMPTKKSKKSLSTRKSPTVPGTVTISSNANNSKDSPTKSNSSSSKMNGIKSSASSLSLVPTKPSVDAKPDLLSASTKLAPLDPSIALELPTISVNYRPMPLNPTVMDCVFNTNSSSATKTPVRTLTDAEALSHGISSKTMRTKIYSGVKTGQILQVPSLFDLCIRILQKNIDALEYTGGVPFEVLRPVLERATPQQLLTFEEYNPYLMEDSDELWKLHVQRNYRTQKRQEMESWREMFLRCQEDQERKLSILAESIKQSQKIIAAPVRKTQLAFVDSLVKPPRNVQRKQEQFGTKSKLIATPASRVASLSSVTPNAARTGDARLRVAAAVRDTAQVSHAAIRPKKAPLMAKTLQFMRGRHKR